MSADNPEPILQSGMLLDTNFKALSDGSANLAFDKYNLDLFLIDEPCFRILDRQFPVSFEGLMGSVASDPAMAPREALQKIQLLLEKGILFAKSDPASSSHTPNIRRAPMRKRFLPKNFYLSIVQDCNLKCDYCSAGHGRFGKEAKRMDVTTAKRSLDLLLCGDDDRKVRSVIFAGGEPLLNTETLFYALEYGSRIAKQNNLSVYFSFNSNGTLLTEEISEELTKYQAYVTFSIDGTKEIHDAHRRYPDGRGSYDLAVRNFRIYCEKMEKKHGKFYPRIQCCLPAGAGLYKSFCSLKQLGASMLVINPAWPSSFVGHDLELKRSAYPDYLGEYELILRDMLEQLGHTPKESRCVMASTAQSINLLSERRAKPLGCGAARDCFAIGSDGNVYPCGLFLENDAYCIGNVNTEICLDKMQGIQQKVSDLCSKCRGCWAVSLCGAACLGMAVAQDRENDPEPTSCCELFRGYIKRDLLLYAEIYRRFGMVQFIDFSTDPEGWASREARLRNSHAFDRL